MRNRKYFSSEGEAMDIIIKAATVADIDAVAQLYDAVNEHLAEIGNPTGWIKNSYPVRADAETALSENTLYVAFIGEKLAGAVVLNQKPAEEYFGEAWEIDCEWSETLIVHTLAVHPDYLRQGVAEALLRYAEKLARELGCRAIRLDSYRENTPAFALYEKLGYRHVGMVDLNLQHFDLDWFRMYELEIK